MIGTILVVLVGLAFALMLAEGIGLGVVLRAQKLVRDIQLMHRPVTDLEFARIRELDARNARYGLVADAALWARRSVGVAAALIAVWGIVTL